jgi:hypothetical protein
MSEELRQDLLDFFEEIFNQRASRRPFWEQAAYRDSFFNLFRGSYAVGGVHGDHIEQFLRDKWFPNRPDLTDEDKRQVQEMCAAWSEWLYAWRRAGISGD